MKSYLRLCCLCFAVFLGACGVNTSQEGGVARLDAELPSHTPTAAVSENTPIPSTPTRQPSAIDLVATVEALGPTVTPTQEPSVFVTIEPAKPYDGPTIIELPMQSDAPPANVPAELPEVFGGTMFSCQALPDDSLGLQITIYEPVYELGQGFNFCLSGYQDDLPIEGTVLSPDGISVPFFLFPDSAAGLEYLHWIPYAYGPLGEYLVTVVQGEATAEAQFSLQAASKPQFVMEPYHGAGNDFVPVLFAGFEPNSMQELFLYRYENGTWHYYASLPAVQFDSEGLLSLNLHIPEAYPSGMYQIVVPGLSDEVYPVTFSVE